MTPRNKRQSWDEYFLELARATARRSTCLRTPQGVGAVIVRDNRVLATGYAGSIRGAPHCDDDGVGCMLDARGKCVRTVHAEINAVLQAAQHGVNIDKSVVYCTMSPCWECFKALVNGGVVRMVYEVEYTDVTEQRVSAAALGVSWVHHGDAMYEPGVRS